MPKRILILALAVVLAGCAPNNPEELDRLMKSDPNFRQMVSSREHMRAEIQKIKADLLARKKIMDSQIDKLRSSYDAVAKIQNLKIEKYQANIDTNRNDLKRQVETRQAQLKAKETELAALESTLSEIQNVLKGSKSIQLTASEKQRWEERKLMQSEKMRPLAEDIEELKIQIDLAKKKSAFLS